VNRREFLAASLAAPAVIRAASRRRALALVTADREAHVVVYDLAQGRVLRDLPTLPGPRIIETVANGAFAVVAHTSEGALSLIDLVRLRVHAVLDGFDEPRYTAAGPDGRLAYVTDAGRGEIVTIDLHQARVASRITVGTRARHLSASGAARQLWTALGFSAPELVALELSDSGRLRVAARIEPPFHAHDVVFAPDGSRVWISSGDERRLAVYETRRRRRLFTLTAGQPPQHITFTSWAACVTSDDALRMHRLADGALLREVPVPAGSYNVTQGAGRVMTPSLERGTLCVLDRSGRVLASPVVARTAHDACFVQ
jgi:hypothetical protein